jgi:hypothetical protein
MSISESFEGRRGRYRVAGGGSRNADAPPRRLVSSAAMEIYIGDHP